MSLLEKIQSRPMPLAVLMGVTFTQAQPDKVVATMVVREDLCTLGHTIHGGAVMAFADSVGAAATVINLPPDAKGTTTIESKTNFFRAIPAGDLVRSESVPLHVGRKSMVVQTSIFRADGKLAAMVTQTQFTLRDQA